MNKDDGGPAFPCSRCGETASHRQGRQWLCPRHYRFGQMRASAKRHGKAVPTHDQIEEMVPLGMICPECTAPMNWLGRDGQTHVVTLQHYRDGSLAVICRSCNTRHAFAPGDSFRDAPKDTKYCPKCERFKPLSDYVVDNSRRGPAKRKSWCKPCSDQSHTSWRIKNRDYYNAKQREGRARRAAS